ncbi:hypothetical protein V8G54_021022 [Vigna mungo]|uniref:Uncharacterized protein n=1 Tax=Vigna mungo TaxID=3915 RepID=A0AAQ3NDK8_VIGMU
MTLEFKTINDRHTQERQHGVKSKSTHYKDATTIKPSTTIDHLLSWPDKPQGHLCSSICSSNDICCPSCDRTFLKYMGVSHSSNETIYMTSHINFQYITFFQHCLITG